VKWHRSHDPTLPDLYFSILCSVPALLRRDEPDKPHWYLHIFAECVAARESTRKGRHHLSLSRWCADRNQRASGRSPVVISAPPRQAQVVANDREQVRSAVLWLRSVLHRDKLAWWQTIENKFVRRFSGCVHCTTDRSRRQRSRKGATIRHERIRSESMIILDTDHSPCYSMRSPTRPSDCPRDWRM
jgi:hypothetical protein